MGLTPRLQLPIDPPTLSAESIRWISGTHLALAVRGSKAIVEDLCSSNGTWVNGERLEELKPRALQRRNEIVIAGVDPKTAPALISRARSWRPGGGSAPDPGHEFSLFASEFGMRTRLKS